MCTVNDNPNDTIMEHYDTATNEKRLFYNILDQMTLKDFRTSLRCTTPLHHVSKHETISAKSIKLFLDKWPEAAVMVDERTGNTPLHITLENKNVCVKVVQHMLDTWSGALKVKNREKNTPRHCAILQMNTPVQVFSELLVDL